MNPKDRSHNSRIFAPQIHLSVQDGRNLRSLIKVTDMSACGIQLKCTLTSKFRPGHRLSLHFLGPDLLKDIALEADVRSCRPSLLSMLFGKSIFHLNCKFIFSNDDSRSRLTEWCAQQLTHRLGHANSFKKRLVSHLMCHKMSAWNFQPAETPQDMRTAFQLIYKEYLKRGYIPSNPLETFFHFHSLLPHTLTFVAKNRRHDIGGTISLVPDHPEHGLPMDKIFSDEIGKLRSQGRRIGEVGLLATDKTLFPNKSFALGNHSKMKLLFHLYRIMFVYARERYGLDDLVITVNPSHAPIYKFLYFAPLGETRSYASVNHAPAVLMRMNIRELAKTANKDNPLLYRFFHPENSRCQKKKYDLTSQEINYFLGLDTSLGYLSDGERKALQSLYLTPPVSPPQNSEAA